MEKSTAEKFKKENRPVWFLDTWSALPVKARITELCRDGRAVEYAGVECIHDAGCGAYGSRGVHFHDLYPSKEELLVAVYKAEQEKIAEIKTSIKTKDDCIRFMYSHTVSPAEEYTDETARRAIRETAKERWGLNLE